MIWAGLFVGLGTAAAGWFIGGGLNDAADALREIAKVIGELE